MRRLQPAARVRFRTDGFDPGHVIRLTALRPSTLLLVVIAFPRECWQRVADVFARWSALPGDRFYDWLSQRELEVVRWTPGRGGTVIEWDAYQLRAGLPGRLRELASLDGWTPGSRYA